MEKIDYLSDSEVAGQVSPAQIALWRKKHGKIWAIIVDGDKACYLRKPTRQEVSVALIVGQRNPIGSAESIINSCWLGGCEEIRTDDDLFLSVVEGMPSMIEYKLVEVKNL